MNQATPAPHGQGGLNLTPSDIYFIFFRHKKKIVLFVLLGLIAGATVYKIWPETYYSSAQLLIRYVTEKREVVDSNQGTSVTKAGGRGNEHILQTEIAIITSLDLAKKVAQKIEGNSSSTDPSSKTQNTVAAEEISKGISAISKANVITITYTHENPLITQTVLQTVVDEYIQRHVQVHRGSGGAFDDFLTQQTDQLKAKLIQTENELLSTLSKVGVIDIDEAKRTLAAEIGRIRQSILETEVELAGNNTSLEEMEGKRQALIASTSDEGEDAAQLAGYNKELVLAVEQYENTRTALEILKSRERELLMRYTEENSLVKGVRNQIKDSVSKIDSISERFPEVVQTQELYGTAGDNTAISRANTLETQRVRVKALQSKLGILKNQLAKLEEDAYRIESVEVSVNELKRRRSLQEVNYQNFLVSLERSRLEEALSSGTINNISIIQSPSPVAIALSEKQKYAAMALIAIAGLGIGWAFLVELLLDRTVKRPIDIQREIGIPLFLTLPDTNGKAFRKLRKDSSTQEKQNFGKRKAANANTKTPYTPRSTTLQAAAKNNPDYYGTNAEPSDGNGTISPWDINHPLHNYFEALRDKVIGYFESKNLQHKPKLIGLTGLGEDPGVSTVASGIASSLSKTEGGNVLLVDMTLGKESAHQFYKGEEVSNLEEALLEPKRAQLQDNLYVVAEGSNGYKLPGLLPSRFNSIIPKLKASDFDYIVFDMPAVSPISATPRLASFMDVMLMVIESENTNIEVVKQATALLSDSKAHLGAVLNKTKSYVPKQLEQDFIGLS